MVIDYFFRSHICFSLAIKIASYNYMNFTLVNEYHITSVSNKTTGLHVMIINFDATMFIKTCLTTTGLCFVFCIIILAGIRSIIFVFQ